MEDLYEKAIEMCFDAIDIAEKEGMVAEIMASALINIKEYPTLSILESLNLALEEWDLKTLEG